MMKTIAFVTLWLYKFIRSTQKTLFKHVFHDIIGRIEAAMEKYDEINLSTLEIIFKFIDIRTGGSGTTSRERISILNKSSVIVIKMMTTIAFGTLWLYKFT